MRDQSYFNSFLHRLADLASSMLDPDEQLAACGDIEEAGESGSHALLDVLSLVIRRTAACLHDWTPWRVLVGLSLPLGALVSLESRRISDGSAIELCCTSGIGIGHIFEVQAFGLSLGNVPFACSRHISRPHAGLGRVG